MVLRIVRAVPMNRRTISQCQGGIESVLIPPCPCGHLPMSSAIRKLFSILIVLISLSQCHSSVNFVLNQTGGSFPNSVYQQSTFSYNFVDPTVSISYYGPSSSVGKCNIMGYWHTSNNGFGENVIPLSVKTLNQLVCTDKCTNAACGYTPITNATFTLAKVAYTGLTIRPNAKHSIPLADIGASDSLLAPADYFNFPDLQMLPAVAGAVVPIYNIPELAHSNITTPLILSRSSLVNIFMGKIHMWNDPSILLDNSATPRVRQILSTLTRAISLVVRTDSSGTSQVFTSALDLMSPAGFAITQTGLVASIDGSFHSQITPSGASERPYWCGQYTDELQYITVLNCNSAATMKALHFIMVDYALNLRNVTFNCDATPAVIQANIFATLGINVHVALTNQTSYGINKMRIELGYGGILVQQKNWYNPILLSSPSGVTVTVKAFQEGSYLNTVSTCTSAPSTVQTMSVWILSASAFQFILTWNSGGTVSSSGSIAYAGVDISATIKAAINAVAVSAVTSVTKNSHGSWTEYRIIFASSTQSIFSTLSTASRSASLNIGSYLDYNNYPCFYDTANPRGYQGSGRYTCYQRQKNFTAWSYYSGYSNPGVVAEVISRPYAIGYSVLEIALAQNLPTASMINKAGATVVATSQSVAFAIMDKGGNLNSLFQATLADGSSSNAWPISGFTYFIIRNNHHISAGNCARRSAAMEYLYNFYNSPTVAIAAQKLGFAALPAFVASIILTQLTEHAMCDNGQYALEKYRIAPSPILGCQVIKRTIDEYLSAYTAVDSTAIWSPIYNDNSHVLLSAFNSNPDAYSGVFSMFATRQEKLNHFNRTDVLTSAFANVALVPLYHLNAYTNANSGTNAPLQLTAEIMGGILSGTIQYWNDTQIQQANPYTKQHLPNMIITVIVRPFASDTNGLMLRFLLETSPTFKSIYTASGAVATNQFNFSSLIPAYRLKSSATNSRVDSIATTFDGSFGYYLQNSQPVAAIANYCIDPTCSLGVVNPSALSSIKACESDQTTVINPRENVVTYDLMASSSPGCYPIVGTVDYSLLATTDNTCTYSNLSSNVLKNRVEFGSWLYSSSVIVQPLALNSIGSPSNALRYDTYMRVCDINCNDAKYGYTYCGYRDCSWNQGDYVQSVTDCDPMTSMRTVSYTLIGGTNNTCIRNPHTIPPSAISISCSNVLSNYRVGKVASALAAIGMIVCALIMGFVILYRSEKIMRKSQPIFIYIFISGAFLMNLSILAQIGTNSDSNCLLRPWSIDISSTIMFAPLLMKLHRIDMLFRASKKLKKAKIQDWTVALKVFGLVCVDLLILIIWTAVDRPVERVYFSADGGLYQAVEHNVCSNTIASPLEEMMVAWKAILLAAGVYKSICTWDLPSDIAEVKHFFLAIYNVSVVGGAMYFFSLYGSSNVDTFVTLRCVGIFVCGTLPVLIIMIPKFLLIQYKEAKTASSWVKANIVDKISGESRSKDSIQDVKASMVNTMKDVSDRLNSKMSQRVYPNESPSQSLTLGGLQSGMGEHSGNHSSHTTPAVSLRTSLENKYASNNNNDVKYDKRYVIKRLPSVNGLVVSMPHGSMAEESMAEESMAEESMAEESRVENEDERVGLEDKHDKADRGDRGERRGRNDIGKKYNPQMDQFEQLEKHDKDDKDDKDDYDKNSDDKDVETVINSPTSRGGPLSSRLI